MRTIHERFAEELIDEMTAWLHARSVVGFRFISGLQVKFKKANVSKSNGGVVNRRPVVRLALRDMEDGRHINGERWMQLWAGDRKAWMDKYPNKYRVFKRVRRAALKGKWRMPEYSHIDLDPEIGGFECPDWKVHVAALAAHELSHAAVIFEEDRYPKPHGPEWRKVYRALRKQFINHRVEAGSWDEPELMAADKEAP